MNRQQSAAQRRAHAKYTSHYEQVRVYVPKAWIAELRTKFPRRGSLSKAIRLALRSMLDGLKTAPQASQGPPNV